MQSKHVEELVEQSAGERKVPSGRQGRSGAGGSARMWCEAERTGGAVALPQFRIGFGRFTHTSRQTAISIEPGIAPRTNSDDARAIS